jgi:cystathionine beta-synthase
MNQAKELIDLIGNTPIIQVKRLDTGKCNLFLKLKNTNPGYSIKDRVALNIINNAEKEGQLNKDSTIIEASAGNTALGLALIARIKGYKATVVILDKMNENKIFHLRAIGANVITTSSDVGPDHPDHYVNVAKKIAKETPNSFYASQFTNMNNLKAHELTTAPEIFNQMNGNVDAIVCGVGTGGTISGIGKYFSEHSPKTEMVLADPEGSIVKDVVEKKEVKEADYSWYVEGIGEDFIPDTLDLSYVDDAVTIHDNVAFETLDILLKKEGILAGPSAGTLVAGAIEWCRAQTEPKRVVTLICDTGNKYLSKAFDDAWLTNNLSLISSHYDKVT